MDFSVATRTDERQTVLKVSGEVDLLTAPKLQTEIRQAITTGRGVAVDLADVSFMDSTGLRVLVESRERATETGVEFVIETPSKQVSRLLSVTGLSEYFEVRDVASTD